VRPHNLKAIRLGSGRDLAKCDYSVPYEWLESCLSVRHHGGQRPSHPVASFRPTQYELISFAG